MFSLLKKTESQAPFSLKPSIVLEPHVDSFTFLANDKTRFIFPFQVITIFLAFFSVLALYLWISMDNLSIIRMVVWTQCMFLPFYIPGLYYYYAYAEKEKNTVVELDRKHELIQYTNEEVNLLFHKNQVLYGEIFVSVVLPYEVDFLVLHLRGGGKVIISSLVIEPRKIARLMNIPCTIKRKFFNTIPQ